MALARSCWTLLLLSSIQAAPHNHDHRLVALLRIAVCNTGCFYYWSPLNLAKSQSLYEILYSNFFSRILLLVLGLSQI